MTTTPQERREHRRVQVPSLQTPYGEVVDLSVTGMKVYHKGGQRLAVGDRVEATLDHPAASARVSVEVVWVEEVGLRRRLVGCRFVELSPEAGEAVQKLVGAGHDEVKGPAVYLDRG